MNKPTPGTPAQAPLNDADVAELDQLLQALPEAQHALDVAMLDGFLAATLLAAEPVPMAAWLPWVFDVEGRETAVPRDPEIAPRMLELIQRRHNELAAYIAAREAFEPVIFEPEDEHGEPLTGKAEIAALEPWAEGFAAALEAFPDVLERLHDSDATAAISTGILRHLAIDDGEEHPDRDALRREREQIERDFPLADLDEAIDLLVDSVFTIADITRPRRPFAREAPKVGRNDPCPCGSGRKYKQCHGSSTH